MKKVRWRINLHILKKKGKTQTLAELLWREEGRAKVLILASECRMRGLGGFRGLDCFRGLVTLWASL